MSEKAPRLPTALNPDASSLEQRYGDCAAEYAEVREETARSLGDHHRAKEWQKVEQELRSDDAA